MSSEPRRFSADSIATELGGAAIPEGYVCFRGYLHDGNGGGTHRIVVDDQFLRWLEVSTEDIAGRLDVPADAADPRDQIWVRRGARMTKCEVGYAPDIANEGWGVDAFIATDDSGLDTEDAAILSEANGGRVRRRPPPWTKRRHPPPPY